MPTNTDRKLGALGLAAALMTTALVLAAAPTIAGHEDCHGEFTLVFDEEDSGDLNRALGDTVDTWVVDVPNRPGDVQLDVDETGISDPLEVSIFEKVNGNCQEAQDSPVEVVANPEFEGLADDQRYWIHVLLKDGSDVGEYSIIMEDD